MEINVNSFFRITQMVFMRQPNLVVRLASALIRTIGMEPIGCLALILRYFRSWIEYYHFKMMSLIFFVHKSHYNIRYEVLLLMTHYGLTWQHTTIYLVYKRAIPIGWILPLTYLHTLWFLIGLKECRWRLLGLMGWCILRTKTQHPKSIQSG